MASMAGERQAAIYAYRIPLDPPLVLASGSLVERRGWVLQLVEGDRTGYGEAAPLPGFSIEDLDQSEAALRQLAQTWLAGGDPACTGCPSAQFAFDCAGLELAEGPLRSGPASDPYPLLSGSPDALLLRWRQWPPPRPAVIKLKLGHDAPALEAGLLEQLLAIAPVRLRLDVNRGWSPQAGIAFCDHLSPEAREAIDYIEEPCRTPADSVALMERYGLSLALDESLREPGFRLPQSERLAALVLKPGIGGGFDWLDGWLTEGRRRGLRCVLSSGFESSLGIGQLAALAARHTPDEPPGLDTLGRFGYDLIRPAPGSARPLLTLETLPCHWRG